MAFVSTVYDRIAIVLLPANRGDAAGFEVICHDETPQVCVLAVRPGPSDWSWSANPHKSFQI